MKSSVEGKKLLILGANAETIGLVKTARELGATAIVTDNNPKAIAKKVADISYDIDGTDIRSLEEMAIDEKVDGIMVGTADPLVKPYFLLCERLGLPCYVTAESIDAFTDKMELRKACLKFGINGIPNYSLKECEAGDAVFPVIVKPADGRSGMGATLCHHVDEVKSAIDKALDNSKQKKYIIERYMTCDDAFMYYTFCDGHYYLSAMADRYVSNEQEGAAPVVLGATYPSKYTDLYMKTMHEKMCNMFSALKIKNGVFLLQTFVEGDSFYVYDPGFRLQGGAPHQLMKPINGIDQRKMLINFALTGSMNEPDMERKNDPYFNSKIGASQTILLKPGVINRIYGIDELSKDSKIVATTQRLFEGDEVCLSGTEQEILVRFHMVCENTHELKELVTKINRTVYATNEKGENMCLKGLFES